MAELALRSRPGTCARVLEAPVDGVVADVLEHDFWPARWGPRPIGLVAARGRGAGPAGRCPDAVPLYARCYLPAAHGPASYPVLDVDRTFVTVVGRDLLHYVMRVFLAHDDAAPDARPQRVPFWSELVELFDPERVGPGIMEPRAGSGADANRSQGGDPAGTR